NKDDFKKVNEGFFVSGRIIAKYENEIWTYTEEIFTEPSYKEYEDEEIDISYIEEPDKAVFIYYDDKNCVGQLKLCFTWNGHALIEDIAVAKD
ncbi:GNAT family N-acetyltransferase, partial [Brevibacillus sp. SIMBA_076]|uniref:GNAT family N-acetyltransferase n=1 Tax=Brevibacillus sp. SIMBA_076 TaxID=3085814 RepID=UPI00397E7975